MNSMRPSRHEEDIMLEKQAKFVGERFDKTEDLMANLCSAFSKFTHRTAKYRDSNDDIAAALNDYATKEQINITLKESLSKLAQSLATLSDHRDNSTMYLEEQVMTSLTQYATRCKNCNSELKNVYKAKEKQTSKRRQLTKIRQRLPQNVKIIMKAEGDLVEASSKVSQLQDSLEEYALSFEMSKLTDLKRILHDFVKAELIFHCRAVETLTTAFAEIGDINVETDYQMFKEVLNRPNMAVRLDIVRNTGPTKHRVGIPKTPDESAVSTATDDVLTSKQILTTQTSERTSVGRGPSAISESVECATSDDDDDSEDYTSDEDDEYSSTIYVKPSTAPRSEFTT